MAKSQASRAPARRAPWAEAVGLVGQWLAGEGRADGLIDALPQWVRGVERARVQHLFYGVLREWNRLDHAIAKHVVRTPRDPVQAVLLVAGYELLTASRGPEGSDAAGQHAKIVHHAVEESKALLKPAEIGLVNAVARKLSVWFAADVARGPASPEDWAVYFAHPAWLVARWRQLLGDEATEKLLQWNQQVPPVHVRWRATEVAPPDWLLPTVWPEFYLVTPAAAWSDVEAEASAGRLYIQDPSTRLAPELLAPRAGETILDLCAAPGGKALLLADALQTGQLVALDVEGPRLSRLSVNLSHAPKDVRVAVAVGDILEQGARLLEAQNLPSLYDAVLVDVPCSNTGVMRHRVDVKWRLREGDFVKHAEQQLRLLVAAAKCVINGGRLVYSTCSLESAENDIVVDRFLSGADGLGWRLQKTARAYPWTQGHDGAGAFLLVRE